MITNLICIAEYGHRDFTIKAVESIRKTDPGQSIVCVGNDGYQGKGGDYSIPFDAILFNFNENVGFTKNINRLVLKSYISTLHCELSLKDTVLFICNNDIEFTEGSIEILSAYAYERDCLVSPALVLPEAFLNPDGFGLHPQFMTHRVVDSRPLEILELTAISSACLAMPMHIWLELNGFDEDYEIYYVDDQFCIDAAKAGYKVVYNPHAVVIHNQTTTMGVNQAKITKAHQLFMSKNNGRNADGSGRY
jgi:GT2 family glycosyltransferase